MGTHRIDQILSAGNIPAEATKRLGKRALDDVDATHRAVACRDACAINSDGVDLVAISHRVVALGEVANVANRGNVAIHRVQTFEYNQLRSVRRGCGEDALKVGDIVVAPDLLFQTGLADALDHRVVVEFVGQDQAIRDQFGDGRYPGLVGDISRGEDERGRLAVQSRELALELDKGRIGPTDIARRPRRFPCGRPPRSWR
jgi:hypothetical protein